MVLDKLRTQVVEKSGLATKDERKALLELLESAYQGEFEIKTESQMYELVTVTRAQNLFSGHSIKLKNFEFKIEQFLSGLALVFVGSTMVEKAIEASLILKTVFDAVKIKIDEKDSLILFSLHHSGKKVLSEAEALSILKDNWKIYPEYGQSDSEFIHSLEKLASIKIISFEDNQISLIESIQIRYR